MRPELGGDTVLLRPAMAKTGTGVVDDVAEAAVGGKAVGGGDTTAPAARVIGSTEAGAVAAKPRGDMSGVLGCEL